MHLDLVVNSYIYEHFVKKLAPLNFYNGIFSPRISFDQFARFPDQEEKKWVDNNQFHSDLAGPKR